VSELTFLLFFDTDVIQDTYMKTFGRIFLTLQLSYFTVKIEFKEHTLLRCLHVYRNEVKIGGNPFVCKMVNITT